MHYNSGTVLINHEGTKSKKVYSFNALHTAFDPTGTDSRVLSIIPLHQGISAVQVYSDPTANHLTTMVTPASPCSASSSFLD